MVLLKNSVVAMPSFNTAGSTIEKNRIPDQYLALLAFAVYFNGIRSLSAYCSFCYPEPCRKHAISSWVPPGCPFRCNAYPTAGSTIEKITISDQYLALLAFAVYFNGIRGLSAYCSFCYPEPCRKHAISSRVPPNVVRSKRYITDLVMCLTNIFGNFWLIGSFLGGLSHSLYLAYIEH